jgi:hypothetical protein
MGTDRMKAVLLFDAEPIISIWQMDGGMELTVWCTDVSAKTH